MKFIPLLRVVLGALATATLCGFVYARLLMTPFPPPEPMRKALLVGLLIAFIAGCFTRLWANRLTPEALGAAVGIIAGATWDEHGISDISISWWYALESAVLGVWRYHILVFVTVLSGWQMTDCAVAIRLRRQRRGR
jgi:hypothetical protein